MQGLDHIAAENEALEARRRRANATEWGRRANATEWGNRAVKAIKCGDFDLAINLCNQAKLELGHLKLRHVK